MAEKSVREMTERERRRFSLSAKVFRATLMGSLVLGLVAIVIGLGLYLYALVGQYVGEAFGLSRSTSIVVAQVVDTEPLADEVMRIYRSLTPEELAMTGTPDYREKFAHVTETPEYRRLNSILREFGSSSEVQDVYFAVYDQATSAIVYVCDPEDQEDLICAPGDWEPLEPRELNKFLNWDGTGQLYDIGNTEKYGLVCTAGVPLRNTAGELLGFILADITLGNIADGLETFAVPYILILAIVVDCLGLALTKHMRKTLVKPINDIAEAAQDYVNDKREGVPTADHFAMLNIRSGDEIENLSLVMADMERGLSEYEDHLAAITSEKERLNTELYLANRIQADMLPNIFPPFPDREEFDIYAAMNPAKEVGGDFYDFYLIDDNHLGLVIADISGKGIPAALFMMAAKILVKTHIMTGLSPHEVLEKLNEQICANNREEMFITLWLGVLDLSTGRLTASNAGHEYPILKKPGGSFEVIKDQHGFAVGGMEEMRYRDYELQLEPGSKLFLYTDGLPEAANAGDELFGLERTLHALNAVSDEKPKAILEKTKEDVDRFTRTAPQFDDLTMMCLQYSGYTAEEGPQMKRLEVEAIQTNLEKVTDFINAELEALDCPLKTQTQIDVAVDELFSNIVHYAYVPNTGMATIFFDTEDDQNTVVISFLDQGIPFNPVENKDPDVTLNATDRPIGGLGIFLVKKTMDSVYYERREGQNFTQIRKRIR